MAQPPVMLSISREIFDRLPPSLKADLLRGSDRSIEDASTFVGAPKMPGEAKLALFGPPGGFGDHLPASFAGPYPRGGRDPAPPQDPMRGAQFLVPGGGGGAPQVAGFGAPGNGPVAQAVRRLPWAIWGTTALTALQVASADQSTYKNPTAYVYVITAVTFSQGADPIRLNPSFRIKINPASGRPWSLDRVDLNALCSNWPTGQLPNTPGFECSIWELDEPYLMGRSDSMAISVKNNSVQTPTVSVGLVAYKRDELRTPRIFWNSITLAASASDTPLDGSKFSGDGDFDLDVMRVVIGSGKNTWGLNNPTSPLIQLSYSQSSYWMKSPCMAVNLNNNPGGLGAYWRLRQPQRIAPGTGIGIELEETENVAVSANVGLLGYLEAPA